MTSFSQQDLCDVFWSLLGIDFAPKCLHRNVQNNRKEKTFVFLQEEKSAACAPHSVPFWAYRAVV